jgi:hypothetical protein
LSAAVLLLLLLLSFCFLDALKKVLGEQYNWGRDLYLVVVPLRHVNKPAKKHAQGKSQVILQLSDQWKNFFGPLAALAEIQASQ